MFQGSQVLGFSESQEDTSDVVPSYGQRFQSTLLKANSFAILYKFHSNDHIYVSVSHGYSYGAVTYESKPETIACALRGKQPPMPAAGQQGSVRVIFGDGLASGGKGVGVLVERQS